MFFVCFCIWGVCTWHTTRLCAAYLWGMLIPFVLDLGLNDKAEATYSNMLPLLLLIIPLLTFTLNRRGLFQGVTVIIICISLYQSIEVIDRSISNEVKLGLFKDEQKVISWLSSQKNAHTIISLDGARLAVFDPRSRFITHKCEESPRKLQSMLQMKKADYLLTNKYQDKKCKYFKGLRSKLKKIKSFGKKKNLSLWSLRK